MASLPAFLPRSWSENKLKVSGVGVTQPCPIWGNVIDNVCVSTQVGEAEFYWSPRAGGAFRLEGGLSSNINSYVKSENEKVRFSKWVFEKNTLGEAPKISISNISKILEQNIWSLDEKIIRVLRLHEILAERPSAGVWTGGPVVQNAHDIKNLLLAGSDSGTLSDYTWLRDAAVQDGLLSALGHNGCNHIRLTPKGMLEIAQSVRKTSARQAFVAMWFDSEMDDVFIHAISPSILETGYTAYRVDKDNSHSDQITNKILAEIKRSKFVIADFTHGSDGARGGVHFEAGYALGLGIPVLWAIRKDEYSKMHFDTNHYPHIVWETHEEFKSQLKDAIVAHQHIGIGPNKF